MKSGSKKREDFFIRLNERFFRQRKGLLFFEIPESNPNFSVFT